MKSFLETLDWRLDNAIVWCNLLMLMGNYNIYNLNNHEKNFHEILFVQKDLNAASINDKKNWTICQKRI